MEYNHLNIKNFKKVNDRTSPEALSPEELVKLENLVLDNPLGLASLRGGFRRIFGQVSTQAEIHSIHDLTDNDNINWLYATIGHELRRSKDFSLWEAIKGGLAEVKSRIINYGGNFLVTNGQDKPFYVRNTPINGQSVFDMELPTPDANRIVMVVNPATWYENGTLANGTKMDDGRYRYAFVFSTNDGQDSGPSVPIANISYGADNNLVGSNYAFNLPRTDNPRISVIKIYRTKKDVLNTFYLLDVLNMSRASQSQTSGTLRAGTAYLIESYVQGDDFTNIGNPPDCNVTGSIFTASGETDRSGNLSPHIWKNGSKLTIVYRDKNLIKI